MDKYKYKCVSNMILRNKSKLEKRKIVVWGAGDNGKDILKILKSYKMDVEYVVDSYKNGDGIAHIEILKGNRGNFFCMVSLDRYYPEVESFLKMNNFSKNDYVYFFKMYRVLESEFADKKGNIVSNPLENIKIDIMIVSMNNKIIVDSNLEIRNTININIKGNNNNIRLGKCSDVGRNLCIEVLGDNNELAIDDGWVIGNNVKIILESNSKVVINSNVRFLSNGIIYSKENSKLIIGANDLFWDNFLIYSFERSAIDIGEESSFADGVFIEAIYSESIRIGKGCTGSRMVSILAGDGHPILDLKTGRQLNEQKYIEIGTDAWLGVKCTILGNCCIKNQVIIGANSVVKGGYLDDNIILAGNIASVIRKGIFWKR